MTTFFFGGHNISSISANDLAQFPDLEVFESSYNPITRLPSDLFRYNPKLKEIMFRGSKDVPSTNNSINEIGKNLLDGLVNLTRAGFLRHKCINFAALNKTEVLTLNQILSFLCTGIVTTTRLPYYPLYTIPTSSQISIFGENYVQITIILLAITVLKLFKINL